jgi:hypothetical protein
VCAYVSSTGIDSMSPQPAGMGKVHKNGPSAKGKFKEGQRVTAGGWCVLHIAIFVLHVHTHHWHLYAPLSVIFKL